MNATFDVKGTLGIKGTFYMNPCQCVDFLYSWQAERKDTLISFMFHLMGSSLSLLALMATLFFSQAR